MLTSYILLALAIAFEMLAASFVIKSKGWTVPKPTMICITGYAFSFYFFGLCLSDINLGIAYATWGAVGTVATSIIGFFYKQRLTRTGVVSLIVIIISIITLNLYGW